MAARVVTPRGDVMYPDVVIACGERRDSDTEIRDPVVVVEVLSGSTEERGPGASAGPTPRSRRSGTMC